MTTPPSLPGRFQVTVSVLMQLCAPFTLKGDDVGDRVRGQPNADG